MRNYLYSDRFSVAMQLKPVPAYTLHKHEGMNASRRYTV